MMENLNPNKDNEIRHGRRTLRSGSFGGATNEGFGAASGERILIVSALMVFALILLLAVVISTYVRKESGTQHNFEMQIEFLDGKFNIVKRCTDKDCEVYKYVKKDVQDVTVVSEELPTCKQEGKRVYGFTEDGTELVYEVNLPKTGHLVNGVDANELKTSDGYLVYDGKFVQVLLGNGSKPECGKTYSADVAGYLCSACGDFIREAVTVIHTKGDKWIAVEGIEVTCVSGGLEVLYCKFCNVEIMEQRASSALSHLYEHKLTYNREANSLQLISTCTRKDCMEGLITDVTKDATVEKVEATCKNPSKTVYIYVIDDKTLQCEVEGDSNTGAHVVNANKRDDGTYDYNPGCTVPMIVGNEKIVCGITSGAFYLKCEECGIAIEQIKVNVPNHNYSIKEIVSLPSFTDDGMVTLLCNNSEWCNQVLVNKRIDKLIVGEGGNATLVPGGGGAYHELFIYKTEVEGCVVEFNITVPKSAVPSN